MKKYLYILTIICMASISCFAQDTLKVKPAYNPALAQKLGADQYGMRTYVIAFLRSGPTKMKDSVARAALQRAHLKNIIRLANEGKLITAGPFLDDQEIRGIFIFNVATVEEARKLTESDPAIQAGELVMELHPWYGSAAMMEIPEIHQEIQRKSVADD